MASVGQVATLGLAAVGGFFLGPIGFSAGMMIGSWLFGEDQESQNVIIDPGAQEMPRVNQALRGVTMPILFGTNRVASNMVWQNNFQTIRHESQQSQGGGGKGGGSGGGGKGGSKGGQTNVSYEYKWDLLYHFGMVSEDFNLFGGWLGPERLNDDTLVAISQGGSGNINFFRSDVHRPQTAALQFAEGFFSGGWATSDTTQGDNWDHFESVVGHAHRFPYTTYIGFKELNLGSQASTPQLSFEIGPGNASLDFDSAYIGNADQGSGNTGSMPGQGVIKGTDGNTYYVMQSRSGTTVASIHRLEDGTRTDHITTGEFDTLATNAGLDPGSSFSFNASPGCATIAGTNYFLMYAYDVGTGSTSTHAFLLCQVGSTGLVEVVGHYRAGSNSIHSTLSEWLRVGISGEQTEDDPICIAFINSVSTSRDFQMVTIPSVNRMISGVIAGSTELDDTQVDLTSHTGDYFGIHQSDRFHRGFGWFLPAVTIGLGPTWNTRFYFLINAAMIQEDDDDPGASDANSYVNSTKATYPNGHIGYFDLGVIQEGSPPDSNAPVVANDDFIDNTTKTGNVPWSDDGQNRAGTTDSNDTYLPGPFCEPVTSGEAAGAYLLMFTKGFDGSEDLGPTGSYTKGRLYIYNPLSNEFTEHANGEGSTFDSVDDIGIVSRYNFSPNSEMLVLDQAKKLVYQLYTGSSSEAVFDDELIISQFGSFDLGGGEDVLPPFIIHEILTSPVFGIGIPASKIDTTSYNLALQYCAAEDIRVSTIYNREQGALQHIELLLATFGGFLTDSGGTIKFGIQDLSATVVRTIDNHHLVVKDGEAPVTVTKAARQESYNKVKVNYLDRALEYRQNFIEIDDEVDQDLNGIRPREFPPKFVMKEALAQKIAARTLWSNLYAKDRYTFKLGPKDSDLEPGDVITLVDSFSPEQELSSGVRCRIVTWEEIEPMVFNVNGVKEVEYINTSTLSVTSASNQSFNQLFGPARAPADFRMYELPQEFQGANPSLFVGWNQLSPAMGARLYISADGTSFAKADDVEPYIISGILAAPLPDRPGPFIEENVKVYLMPDTRSVFTASSPVYVQTHALDDVDGPSRALGGGNFYAGSEMLAYEGVNLIAQNEYRFDKVYRGWGGTNIQAHNSGAFWHKHAGGVFTRAYNEDKIGTIIHYKVVPYNFAGTEFDVASVDARTYQIDGLYFKPQVQPPIHTFVTSLITGTASDDLGALEIKHVHSSGTDVDFTWPDAARVKGYGAAGYGTGGYGRFATDTTSHNYRVQIYSNDLTTVVRCLTVDTGFFTYSVDINSTDFNGWAGDFMIRVTPFNDVGDAPRDQTKRLQLFEQV